MPEQARARRGRPRSEHAYTAIVQATVELLHEVGYEPLTIEGVAARAGVGKQTIYRWWPSKAALVLEAYLARATEEVPPPPDSGSARQDVRNLLGRLATALAQPTVGPAVSGLLAALQHDAALAESFRRDVLVARRQILGSILEQGVARGEFRPGIDVELVIDALYGPIFYRLLLGHAPLDSEFAERLADQVLDGLAQPAAPRGGWPAPRGSGGEARREEARAQLRPCLADEGRASTRDNYPSR